ncbi:GDSL-type esterase/lipase family protein [Kitasatospora sp. NPDC093102]|uniref:GDSL-type esterase/lipase family protein n=1 Tax=Kitasatospora sp. NPDC093102 TaxID=3155069 RepID=UPI003414AE1D
MPTTLRMRAGVLVVVVATQAALAGCDTPASTPPPRTPADGPTAQARTPAQHPSTTASASAVPAPKPDAAAAKSIVVIGASVSGGYKASPDASWPSELAHRLQQDGRPDQVVNASIGATRLLTDNGPTMPSALTREDRDALAVPGAGTIVLTDVINDIQQTPHQYDPAAIIAGLRSFVAKAHAKDVKVIGTTIPPYGGFGRYETAGELCRRTVNDAIRQGQLFDGVIDFDAALRDPTDPTRIRPDYDSGDHLHPNDAGHHAMARTIDPDLFTLLASSPS